MAPETEETGAEEINFRQSEKGSHRFAALYPHGSHDVPPDK
jgi:hypothetical protein